MDVKRTGTASRPRDQKWPAVLTAVGKIQTQTSDLFMGTEQKQPTKASLSPCVYIQQTLAELLPSTRPVPRGAASSKMNQGEGVGRPSRGASLKEAGLLQPLHTPRLVSGGLLSLVLYLLFCSFLSASWYPFCLPQRPAKVRC